MVLKSDKLTKFNFIAFLLWWNEQSRRCFQVWARLWRQLNIWQWDIKLLLIGTGKLLLRSLNLTLLGGTILEVGDHSFNCKNSICNHFTNVFLFHIELYELLFIFFELFKFSFHILTSCSTCYLIKFLNFGWFFWHGGRCSGRAIFFSLAICFVNIKLMIILFHFGNNILNLHQSIAHVD